MPRVPQVYTCAICPHFLKLSRSASRALFSLISQCAGAFSSTPGDANSTSKNEPNNCANNSNENPKKVKPPNPVDDVALFLNLLAHVLAIVVSVLKLLEMANRP